jgi:hypothetical protein
MAIRGFLQEVVQDKIGPSWEGMMNGFFCFEDRLAV